MSGIYAEMPFVYHRSAVCGGVFFTMLGLFFSRTALRLMGTPEDVLDKATLYLKIYFPLT